MLTFSLRRVRRRATGILVLLIGLAPRPATAQLTQVGQVPIAVQARWIDLTEAEWARGKNGKQHNFDYFLGLDPKPQDAGFFGQKLRREMTTRGGLTPEAEAALNRYRRQKKLFLIERFMFVATLIVAGSDIVRNDYSYFENSELVLSGVAIAALLSNVLISRNSNAHLQRAVKEYQGGLIPQVAPTGWAPRLRPAFGGVVPQRGGGVGLVVGWRL